MRYLFTAIADTGIVADATDAEMAAIDDFNDKIEAAGQRVMAVGLAHPDQARSFDGRHGREIVASGPVEPTATFMAGFWVIEAEDDATAHQLALEASRACNRRIEVRAFLR